ncbi:MAG: hypothetical protein CK548_04745 [Opitutia bacterium]|nr:MAG: hypothetical protein CK548_04745 [Opitutae bacterium]
MWSACECVGRIFAISIGDKRAVWSNASGPNAPQVDQQMSIALDDETITLPALLRGRTADPDPKQLQLPAVF